MDLRPKLGRRIKAKNSGHRLVGDATMRINHCVKRTAVYIYIYFFDREMHPSPEQYLYGAVGVGSPQ